LQQEIKRPNNFHASNPASAVWMMDGLESESDYLTETRRTQGNSKIFLTGYIKSGIRIRIRNQEKRKREF